MKKKSFRIIVLLVIFGSCLTGILFCVHHWSSARPTKWFIRANAIRDLLKSSQGDYVVLINEASGKDLFVYGKAPQTAIDEFISALSVERNIVADQHGYSIPESWTSLLSDVEYQRRFPKGSLLIEDSVRFHPGFFVVMLYSQESNGYVIMINNAGKILVRE